MNDLISRSEIINKIESRLIFLSQYYPKYKDKVEELAQIRSVLIDEPTAYDVDKVVERLEHIADHYECEEQGREDVYMVDLETAIDIVKGGGKDE